MYNDSYKNPYQLAYFYNNNPIGYSSYYSDKLISSSQMPQPSNSMSSFYYVATIPITLAKSLEGKYFLGTANDLGFGNTTNAWARLYNPPDSGVNLFVFVWTVTDVNATPYKVEIFFNSTPPGMIQESKAVTPANNTIVPLPKPQVKLEYGVGVRGKPQGGLNAYRWNGNAGENAESEEEGKFIFPPGGSFLVFVSNPEHPTTPASGSIAFGWWEEPIQ